MKVCKNCNKQLDNDEFIICPYCGYRLKEQPEFQIARPPFVLFALTVIVVIIGVVINSVKDYDAPATNRYEEYAKELNSDDIDAAKEKAKIEIEEETKDAIEKKETLSSYIGNKQAKKVKKLLKKIGFNKVSFDSKDDTLEIYYFTCDGRKIEVAAYTDEISAVYCNDNALYIDGKIKMTAKELNNTDISWEDRTYYETIAKDTVKIGLVNGAKFKDPFAIKRDDNLITVQSVVESKNAFNSWVAEKFTVQFYDHGDFDYDIQYVRIGDEEVGKYIK